VTKKRAPDKRKEFSPSKKPHKLFQGGSKPQNGVVNKPDNQIWEPTKKEGLTRLKKPERLAQEPMGGPNLLQKPPKKAPLKEGKKTLPVESPLERKTSSTSKWVVARKKQAPNPKPLTRLTSPLNLRKVEKISGENFQTPISPKTQKIPQILKKGKSLKVRTFP